MPDPLASRLGYGFAGEFTDADFADIKGSKPHPPPPSTRWYILVGLLVPLMAMTYVQVSAGSSSDVRERPVVLTTLATITGPFIGAIVRNAQSCCLDFSLRLAAICGPVLAIGLIAQILPSSHRRGQRTLRLALWTLGWFAWLLSGQASLLHAFS